MELNVAGHLRGDRGRATPTATAWCSGTGRCHWSVMQDRTRRLARVLHDAGLGPTGAFGDGDRWRVRARPRRALPPQRQRVPGGHARRLEGPLRPVQRELPLRGRGAHATCWTTPRPGPWWCTSASPPPWPRCSPPCATPPALILQVADGSGHPHSGLLPGALDYEAALAAATPELPDDLVAGWSGDDLYLCYTGGTTGMPKGAMWRQEDFLVAALGVRRRDGTDFERPRRARRRRQGLGPGAARAAADARRRPLERAVVLDRRRHRRSSRTTPSTSTPVDVLDTVRARPGHVAAGGGRPGGPSPGRRPAPRRPGTCRRCATCCRAAPCCRPGSRPSCWSCVPGLTIVDVLGSTESGRQGVSNVSATPTTPPTAFTPVGHRGGAVART